MSRPALTAGKSSFNNGTVYRVASGIFENDAYGPIPDESQRLDFRARKDAVKHAKKVANQYKAHIAVILYKLVNGRALHREHLQTVSPKSYKPRSPPPVADCKWRSVAEDPARYGTYLGFIPNQEEDKVWPVLFEGGQWYDADGGFRIDVTHWTMMPGKPKGRVWPHSDWLWWDARGQGNCGGCGNTGCGCGGRGYIGAAARRGLPESQFALPLSMVSPAARARIEREWPGAAGGYPMDTYARTKNARSRAVSQLNAGYITRGDAQTILNRTFGRAEQMAGRKGWRRLKPLTLVRTRRGWRSAPAPKYAPPVRAAANRRGRANTVFETYDEAFVEAVSMANRLGRKVELRRAQAFLPKGATRIPAANWLINLVGPHDAIKGQIVNPGEPLTAKQAIIRDAAGRGNQAELGFYGPGLRYLSSGFYQCRCNPPVPGPGGVCKVCGRHIGHP
tara:strand:+ start:451 stop:1797 length:1347 start_codon:yes stop_codon:yes gene_type:complete